MRLAGRVGLKHRGVHQPLHVRCSSKNQNAPMKGIETASDESDSATGASKNPNAPMKGIETPSTAMTFWHGAKRKNPNAPMKGIETNGSAIRVGWGCLP
jgi:hypothetical protein